MPEKLSDSLLLQAFEEADTSGLSDLKDKLASNRFESKKLSGEGGAKEIYKVKDLVTGRDLALAYPRENTEDANELILREARLHSLLEHPNIIRLYDIGVDEGRPFFTMKFVDGFTLEKFIDDKEKKAELSSFDINELLDIFLKVCNAISYAHSKNISHLDIKPSNIFLDDHGEVLLGDWGLARLNSEKVRDFELPLEYDYGQTTLYGYISGTPGYMAPEQCSKGKEKGTLSDIYSLGALLVFMFCGEPPVKGTEKEMVLGTIKGELSFNDQRIPHSIQHIIRKALQVMPEERYQTVDQFVNDIQNYRLGFMTSAEPSSFVKQFKLLVARNQLMSLLIMVFMAILSVVAFSYIENIKASESRTRQALKKNELLNDKRAGEAYQKGLDLYRDRHQGVYGYDSYKNELALSSLNLSLSLDPYSTSAMFLKGKVLMLLNKWEEAKESFDNIKKYKFSDICKAINNLENNRSDMILSLISELGDQALTNHYIFKETYKKDGKSTNKEFVEAALKVLNRDVKNLNFYFDKKSFSLDISNNKNLKNVYPLRTMRIYRLDISNCPNLENFRYISELPLQALNVSKSSLTNRDFRYFENNVINDLSLANCEITRLTPVLNMPVKKLDIRGLPKNNFDNFYKLFDGITIICSENNASALQELNKRHNKNWTIIVK